MPIDFRNSFALIFSSTYLLIESSLKMSPSLKSVTALLCEMFATSVANVCPVCFASPCLKLSVFVFIACQCQCVLLFLRYVVTGWTGINISIPLMSLTFLRLVQNTVEFMSIRRGGRAWNFLFPYSYSRVAVHWLAAVAYSFPIPVFHL